MVRQGDGLPENMSRGVWEVKYLGLIVWLYQQLVRQGDGLLESRAAWEVNYLGLID
jgi:hypothetical protein